MRLIDLVPFLLPWTMMGVGICGATLQAFLFIMLTMVYNGGRVWQAVL